MTKRIKPHGLLCIWSPDEVAECLSIPTELYQKIWRDIVPLYEGRSRSETPDDFGRRCVKKYWSKFSDEEKAQLNAAAEAQERGEYMEEGSPEHFERFIAGDR